MTWTEAPKYCAKCGRSIESLENALKNILSLHEAQVGAIGCILIYSGERSVWRKWDGIKFNDTCPLDNHT